MSLDEVSHMANANIDGAKKYSFATRESYYRATQYRYFQLLLSEEVDETSLQNKIKYITV